jgi:steroid 5-alpha reductase family enzyme
MHGQPAKSIGPRLAMTAAHVAGVVLAVGFLARDGLSPRDVALLVCSVTYLARYLITSFRLLRREVDWYEAAQVAPFLFAIQALFGFLGGRSTVPWRGVDWLFVGLYVLGSYLNTVSELQRERWKRDPGHRGHLFTGGLFSYSMHINYFGDTLLFTGFALLTTSPWALIVPLVMATLFVTFHIPALDAYLSRKYPEEFHAWMRQSRRFVPFLY